jgi:hypothetical protein
MSKGKICATNRDMFVVPFHMGTHLVVAVLVDKTEVLILL